MNGGETMPMVRWFKIRTHERGLMFRDGAFERVLRPGWHFVWDPLLKVRVDVKTTRVAWLFHDDLDEMVKSGHLGDEVRVVDLKDGERALVWIDGRLASVLRPGLFALWTAFKDVRVEVI